MHDEIGKNRRKSWKRPQLTKLAADLAELGAGVTEEGGLGAVLS